MKKTLAVFVMAVLAGVCISIGGTVSLSSDNKYAGAFMFSLGLLTILSFGFNLFTGKVGYLLENKPSYLGELALIWLGNLAGTGISALLIRFTRVYQPLHEKVSGMVAAKTADTLQSLFILGIGCGLCMFIAVNSYKTQEGFLKVLLVVLPVMVFIISGFEHCIADMFYFWLAGEISPDALLRVAIISLGNSVGALIIPAAKLIRTDNKH